MCSSTVFSVQFSVFSSLNLTDARMTEVCERKDESGRWVCFILFSGECMIEARGAMTKEPLGRLLHRRGYGDE